MSGEIVHPVADGQETTVGRKPLSDPGFGRSLGRLDRLVEGRFGSISRTPGRYSGRVEIVHLLRQGRLEGNKF
jgi:hypothetical protein